VAIQSHLNIGHRHILPVYPPLFILAGAAIYWLRDRSSPKESAGKAPSAADAGRRASGAAARIAAAVRARPVGPALAGLMVLLAAEVLLVRPNYLAYFNQIVGPANGYKHLVDSSLDWGQDLPALKRFVDKQLTRRPSARIYLSYFGTASTDYHGIKATLLPGFFGLDYEKDPSVMTATYPAEQAQAAASALLGQHPEFFQLCTERHAQEGRDLVTVTLLKRPQYLRLTGGTYCISASMLQPVFYAFSFGPWCKRYEEAYQSMMDLTRLIQGSGDEEALRRLLLSGKVPDLRQFFDHYEDLRLARLCAYLRDRNPTTNISYSILVYELSDEDIRQALEGPAPSLAPDEPDTSWN